MFQNNAFPRPLDLPAPWLRPVPLRELIGHFPWPRTFRDYLQCLLAMLLLGGLAALQIQASIQVTQARQTLAELRMERRLIQQYNAELVWEIGQATALETVRARALEWGLRPARQLPLPGSMVGATSLPADEAVGLGPLEAQELLAGPVSAEVSSQSQRMGTLRVWWREQWPRWQAIMDHWLTRTHELIR